MSNQFDPKVQSLLSLKSYRLETNFIEGGTARVYQVHNLATDQPMVMKVVPAAVLAVNFTNKLMAPELSLLLSVRHQNIVHVHDIVRSAGNLYLLMDMANGGDLAKYLADKAPLSELQAGFFFVLTGSALRYMHEELGLAHRAVKADNVLVHNAQPVLTALGFAKHLWDKDKATPGPQHQPDHYESPELWSGEPSPLLNWFAVDVWALGVLLFFMLHQKFPFTPSASGRIDHPGQIRAQLDPKLPADLRDLLEHMLAPRDKDRLNMWQVMEHDWVGRIKM